MSRFKGICVNYGRCGAAGLPVEVQDGAPAKCESCGEPLEIVGRGSSRMLTAVVAAGILALIVTGLGVAWRVRQTGASREGSTSSQDYAFKSDKDRGNAILARYFRSPDATEIFKLARAGDRPGLRSAVERNPRIKSIRGDEGITMLHAALLANEPGAFAALIDSGFDPHMSASNGLSAFQAAAMVPDSRFLRSVIASSSHFDQTDKRGRTALHYAVLQRRLENVKLLLDCGVDANTPDLRGVTPLMAAFQGQKPSPEIIRLLLARGANSALKDGSGLTARDYATALADLSPAALLP